MIIFSQAPTKHARLANSLSWMMKIQCLLDEIGRISHFPWAKENFSSYLESPSFWMSENDEYCDLFFKHTNIELNAKNLSSFSRLLERDYEIKNNLKAHEWTEIVTYSDKFKCLYISGGADITSEKILNLIQEKQLIIIHEPYKLQYLNTQYLKDDFRNITPKSKLYSQQFNFINQVSMNKKKIGLHIRRGDYQSWASGKYFYEDDFWLSKVSEFIERNCAVWIFTNETNPSFHSKLIDMGAHIYLESFEVDFVRMLMMDEVYGPPSTFSIMATKIAKSCYGLNPSLQFYPPKC